MEKLIELLSEFINKTIIPYDRGAECILYENWRFIFEDGEEVLEDTVISARYGFIKRLVDNDKIDRRQVDGIVKYVGENYDGSDTEYYNLDEEMLMFLAISENPIEDLISYLKTGSR